MKSLDYFISEPYLMDGVSGVGGGTATPTQTTQTDEQKRLAEAARQATENANKATEGVSSDSSAAADAKAIGVDTNLPGTKLIKSDPANATSSSDSSSGNKSEDFSGASPAPGGLETTLPGGYRINPMNGNLSDMNGNTIHPTSQEFQALSNEIRSAYATNLARINTSEERTSSNPGSTDQAVKNEQATADAVTQPNGSSDGGDASSGDKSSTREAGEAAKTNEPEVKLTHEQEALKAQFDNYDPKANNGNGGTKKRWRQ